MNALSSFVMVSDGFQLNGGNLNNLLTNVFMSLGSNHSGN